MSGPPGPTETPLYSPPPLDLQSPNAVAEREDVRFLIEAVYHITGMDCIVVGMLETGALRLPTRLRIIPGAQSKTMPAVIEVLSANAKRVQLDVVQAGQSVGLTLRGVPALPARKRSLRGGGWQIEKGDRLASGE
jgi:GTPase